MDGLDDRADASGGASGSPEQAPRLQLGEGAFSRRSQAGVVAVELLVVLGLFAVVVVGGADGGAGTLVGAVGEDEDLPGQAGLDDAVSSRGGQVVGAAGCRAGEPQWCAVGSGDDLHIHAVPAMLHRVVRLVRTDPVDGNQGAVNDDVVTFTEAGEGFMEAGRPAGQHVQGLVHVAPGGGLGYPETGSELRERLVLPQVHQRKKRLLEAAELAPTGVVGLAVFVQ